MYWIKWITCVSVFFVSMAGAEEMDLAQLVDLALKQNPKTKEAWARASSAGYEWRSSRSTLYPQVDFQGDCCLGESRCHKGGSVDEQLYELDIAISYLLLDFGGRNATIEASLQGFFASNWTRDRVMQEVILGVLQSYYRYIDAKASLEARKEDLQDASKSLEAAKALFEAGLTTKIDVLQSQSHFVNMQLRLEEIKGIFQISLGDLANAVGLQANTPIQVADLPSDLPLDHISDDVDSLIERAEQLRPDLAAANAQYLQKKADLVAACSEGKPTLSFGMDLHRKNYLHTPSNNGQNYSGCLTLNVPLFHGYYFQNQRRRAQADVEAACAFLQDQESDASLEVLSSYYAFKTSVETFHYSEEFLKYSDETYEAALTGYKEGISTILDVLAAQSSLTRARSEHIQARTHWLVSLANLSYATGMLGRKLT